MDLQGAKLLSSPPVIGSGGPRSVAVGCGGHSAARRGRVRLLLPLRLRCFLSARIRPDLARVLWRQRRRRRICLILKRLHCIAWSAWHGPLARSGDGGSMVRRAQVRLIRPLQAAAARGASRRVRLAG